MKKIKWIISALLSTTGLQAIAEDGTSHIDVPTNGILLLMGLSALVLLLIILRLLVLLRKSMVAKTPALGKIFKRGTMVIILFLITTMSHAQEGTEEAAAVVQSTGWFGLPAWIWLIYFLTIIVELCTIQVLINIISMVNLPEEAAEASPKKQSWFARLNNTVPAEKYDELDLNHDYDGISELDNSIPRWWLYAFYFTIIWGVVYAYRFLVSQTIPTQYEQLEESITQAAIAQRKRDEASGGAIDENTVQMADASGIANGQTLYYANCRACHGDEAQGAAVGPNLTDPYWLHGGSLKDVFISIKNGWPDKGMQSWKAILSPSEMQDVASYIMSVQGTTPPNARAPQGEKYVPTEATPTEESAEEIAPTDSASATTTPEATDASETEAQS